MKDLFFWITIVKRDDTEEYEEFYRENGVSLIYSAQCNGTAHEKTLSLFGIEKTEKAMLFSTITGTTMKKIKRLLMSKMKIDLPDRGVAMAVSLSGVGGMRTFEYFTTGQVHAPETEETEMKYESEHELIIAIYEKGYTDLVMDAARAAGARGGTTIRAKGTGADSGKFFGVTLAEEKEIVFIVSHVDKKKDIMKAIMQNAGVDSKAHALVFSLPVSETAGFRFADTIEKED